MLEQHGSSRLTRSSRLARLARQSRTCRVEMSQVEFGLILFDDLTAKTYAETESTKESHSSCAVLLNYCNIWPSWSQLCYTVDTRKCSVIVFHALDKPTGLVNPDTACTALHPRFAAAWITRISILDLTKVTRNMIIISC